MDALTNELISRGGLYDNCLMLATIFLVQGFNNRHKSLIINWYPHPELNRDQRFRKPSLYPFELWGQPVPKSDQPPPSQQARYERPSRRPPDRAAAWLAPGVRSLFVRLVRCVVRPNGHGWPVGPAGHRVAESAMASATVLVPFGCLSPKGPSALSVGHVEGSA